MEVPMINGYITRTLIGHQVAMGKVKNLRKKRNKVKHIKDNDRDSREKKTLHARQQLGYVTSKVENYEKVEELEKRPHVNLVTLYQIRKVQNENVKQSTLISVHIRSRLIRGDDSIMGRRMKWVRDT